MYVVKRDGRKESVHFDKITSRIQKLTHDLSTTVDAAEIAQLVIKGVYSGVRTTELDKLTAEIASSMSTKHPDFNILASRIELSNLFKQVDKRFSESVRKLFECVHPRTGTPMPNVSVTFYEYVMANADELDSAIVHTRDRYDYFGLSTLMKTYLKRSLGEIAERPQHMLMRVAVSIHMGNLPAIIETYDLLSRGFFTHATPTLLNAANVNQNLASCYLLQNKEDSIEGIYESMKQYAMISKGAGGIGVAIHNVRAKGALIKGSGGGESAGLVPMIRVINETARYVDQARKRKGAIALYLEPWHADIFAFLDMRKNTGLEQARGRDLFYALWIPDLFMKRVEADAIWSLMSPDECPGLQHVYGEEFERMYEEYERSGRFLRQVPAQEVWKAITVSQVETGTPYMLYKDACNIKSNQKNIGTIQSSNLCVEVVQYASAEEVSVCTLASICLPMFVKNCRFSKNTYNPSFFLTFEDKLFETEHGNFDHGLLYYVTRVVVRNLNRVIDVNAYPVPEAEVSSKRHRPIGVGVQGLADVFQMMKLPYESPEAQQLNVEIFETIYFAALSESNALAIRDGPYETFKGSPASKGILQYDMWFEQPTARWDWDTLKRSIIEHGLRNSLLTALMPTASTSQIRGNTESFEPLTSNFYIRRTLAGEFTIVNPRLIHDLESVNAWNEHTRQLLMAGKGSIQHIDTIPDWIKQVYKTVWEMSAKTIVNMSRDRGRYICQSQSLNLHMQKVDYKKLTSYHFHTWRAGLKTGMYYLRTKSQLTAQAATVDPTLIDNAAIMTESKHESKPESKPESPVAACTRARDGECLMCSS